MAETTGLNETDKSTAPAIIEGLAEEMVEACVAQGLCREMITDIGFRLSWFFQKTLDECMGKSVDEPTSPKGIGDIVLGHINGVMLPTLAFDVSMYEALDRHFPTAEQLQGQLVLGNGHNSILDNVAVRGGFYAIPDDRVLARIFDSDGVEYDSYGQLADVHGAFDTISVSEA